MISPAYRISAVIRLVLIGCYCVNIMYTRVFGRPLRVESMWGSEALPYYSCYYYLLHYLLLLLLLFVHLLLLLLLCCVVGFAVGRCSLKS